MNSSHNIKLPLFLSAVDYHDFDAFCVTLNTLLSISGGQGSGNVEWEELSPEDIFAARTKIDFPLGDYNDTYFAVFYVGEKTVELQAAIQDFEGDEEEETSQPASDVKRVSDEVYWIVTEGNDPNYAADGELGVEVNGVPYLYYKWADPTPDNKEKLKYRRIHKREFGEVIRRPGESK